jgi:hypothetical protein
MKLKTNLVLGVLFLALLGFVYFYEIRGGADRKEAEAKARTLLSLGDAEVQGLVIERRDTTLVLRQEGGEWVLTEPVADRADDDAVRRYLQALKETERERVIADSATMAGDPGLGAKYGLASPRLRIFAATAEGGRDTVCFGTDTPTDRFTYAQVRGRNPEVVAVRAWRFDNLDKGVFDLRDRRVLAFDTEAVDEIRLLRPQGRIVLVRSGSEGWRLTEPFAAEADRDEVEQLLNRLRNGRVESFASERSEPAVLQLHGLTGPVTGEVSLLIGRDRAEKRLQIGAPAEQGRYYGRDLSRPQVVVVDSSVASVLRREAADLRNRKPLRFEREAVVGLELERAAGRVAARRDTAGTWSLTEPAGRQATGWKLEQLVTDLAGTKVDSFLTGQAADPGACGLLAPVLVVRAQGESGTLVEARFGQGRDNGIYLSRVGDPQVYRVSAETRRRLDPGLDEVSRAASPSAGADAAAGAGG